jgi:hypothetical protein
MFTHEITSFEVHIQAGVSELGVYNYTQDSLSPFSTCQHTRNLGGPRASPSNVARHADFQL